VATYTWPALICWRIIVVNIDLVALLAHEKLSRTEAHGRKP
jgi:hypothetical protein